MTLVQWILLIVPLAIVVCILYAVISQRKRSASRGVFYTLPPKQPKLNGSEAIILPNLKLLSRSAKVQPLQTLRQIKDLPPHFHNLQQQLEILARTAWKTQDALANPTFSLEPRRLAQTDSLETVIGIMLNHARTVAPGFSVPSKTPRVIVEPMVDAAGQFIVDEEGWVSINVSPTFECDRITAHAILAHEMCHYILENTGLRKANTEENERFTDLCMFICGFGQIFLAGYKSSAKSLLTYRQGHRLGYLSDTEYKWAETFVHQIRQSNNLELPGALKLLQTELQSLVPDREARKRIISHARSRYPHKSNIELYKDEIDSLLRDRR